MAAISPTRSRAAGPVLISFSGIDGAGKSTQIANLEANLADAGMRFTRLALWDDVAVLKRFREDTMTRVFKGETGIGSPERPVRRNDKNVRRWYLTIGRCLLFFLDGIQLRKIVSNLRRMDVDVIIFDRYSFDELASLRLQNRLTRIFARFLLRVVPCPDVGFVLDADPEVAHRRKPEYPVDFLHRYRDAYLFLAGSLPAMKVIEPGSPEQVREHIWRHFSSIYESLPLRQTLTNSLGAEEPHGI